MSDATGSSVNELAVENLQLVDVVTRQLESMLGRRQL